MSWYLRIYLYIIIMSTNELIRTKYIQRYINKKRDDCRISKQKNISSEKYYINNSLDSISNIIGSQDRMIYNIMQRATNYLHMHNVKREITHTQLLSCNRVFLINYIEQLFTDGMNWDNYGKWEIDHIKPVSLCNPYDQNDINKTFCYKNLQPLWKIDNIKKSNKYENK